MAAQYKFRVRIFTPPPPPKFKGYGLTGLDLETQEKNLFSTITSLPHPHPQLFFDPDNIP